MSIEEYTKRGKRKCLNCDSVLDAINIYPYCPLCVPCGECNAGKINDNGIIRDCGRCKGKGMIKKNVNGQSRPMILPNSDVGETILNNIENEIRGKK